jgi:solute carrier family 25 (mitochondrial carnitine/acylcarnitine transporter), member 20/29
VIKTRMQAQDIVVGDVARTSSFWRAVRGLSAEAAATGAGRVRVFWRGFVPTVVRAVPVNMAVFGTFEGVVWAFS